MAVSSGYGSAFARLSASDVINLAVEVPDTPMHMGALVVLDGAVLCDAQGRLCVAQLRAQVSRRLAAVPRLRQVVHPAGLLAGRPVWTDDPAFRIERHVEVVRMPAGQEGGQSPDAGESLLRLAARLLETPLDRAHPLWRMWFVSGLPQGRVGLVVAIHHVLADGLATVRMLVTLLGEASALPPDAPPPGPAPTGPALVLDNIRCRATDLGARRGRPPRSRVRARGLLRGLAEAWHAPRTSLNAVVGPHRRLAVLRLDLAEAKRV
ncbi:MAG: hypothetical protein J2P15_16235, partial [Micromonosporaceae bacterium]|nr:hypothetical protein [Micromonosporaceae bacterium]